jgi:uncharacterized small protein (DUF1192 family)
MCNAQNHPPGCNCGWGQGSHNGGYGFSGFITSLRQPAATGRSGAYGLITNSVSSSYASSEPPHELRDSKHPLKGAWVNPNAKCPVCGCAVFFYCSPDGGRVYFDELGPPWPKHPCTDHARATQKGSAERTASPRWDHDGWQPLVDYQVSLIGSRHLYQVKGKGAHYDRTLLFRLNASFEVDMVRFKEGAGVSVELSLLARDSATKDWLICEGPAKIHPNFPPTEELVIVQRFSDAAISESSGDTLPTGADVICVDDSSPPMQTPQPDREATEAARFAPSLGRVDEIDDRILALLAEIARLNEEKTGIMRAALKSPGTGQR